MRAPTLIAADFAGLILSLLPRGRVWQRSLASAQGQLAAAIAPSAARQHARAVHLLTDAFPSTTNELLPEWEASLGLPDPCIGPQPSIDQRVSQVVARLIGGGSPTKANISAFAAALGFPVTLAEYGPFRCGYRVGQAIYGAAWAHAWGAHAASITVVPFRVGIDRVGEPLAIWPNTPLICELQRIAPAHTVPIITFGGIAAPPPTPSTGAGAFDGSTPGNIALIWGF